MEAISLVDLGPVIAAVLGPMLAFVVVSMRYQHNDGMKTRELIASSEKETRELIASSEKETRDLIASSSTEMLERATEMFERLGAELTEHKRDTKEGFRQVTVSLADARERLARIEGHLGIGAPLPGEAGDAASDAA